MKALILAAGEGTRLRPLTNDRPKPMLPVAGRPLLAITIAQLRAAGISDIAINLHYHPEAITRHFGNGRAVDVSITYSYEPVVLGTAGAARKLRGFLDETFLVIYGDVLARLDYHRLIGFHRSHRAVSTLSLYRVANPTQVGLVGIDQQGQITRFLEKPKPEDVFTDLASAGIVVCEPTILEQVPPETFFDFGHDLFPLLLDAGLPLYGLPLADNEYLIDIGTMDNYERAQREWPRVEAQSKTVGRRGGGRDGVQP